MGHLGGPRYLRPHDKILLMRDDIIRLRPMLKRRNYTRNTEAISAMLGHRSFHAHDDDIFSAR